MSPGLGPAGPTSTKLLIAVARLMMSIRSGLDAVPKGSAPTATAPSASASTVMLPARNARLRDMAVPPLVRGDEPIGTAPPYRNLFNARIVRHNQSRQRHGSSTLVRALALDDQ